MKLAIVRVMIVMMITVMITMKTVRAMMMNEVGQSVTARCSYTC